MRKEILAILMAGLIVVTVFGAMSVSAAVLNKKQEVKTVFLAGVDETGDIGAVVFYKKISTTDDLPVYCIITDAAVYCVDINGDTHDMEYVEYEPEFYAYVAYGVPAGPCEITASKEGFDSETVSAEVIAGGSSVYRIEMEKGSKSHPVFLRLLDLFLNAFPILRLLLKL